MTQNKKRKQSPTFDDRRDGTIITALYADQSIESVLFEEMTKTNNQLISLGNKMKLVGHEYFLANNGIIDEFIGNMNLFLKDLDHHRKKVTYSNINSDILTHVYQFLDHKELVHCCGLVCKLWRESLVGLEVSIQNGNISKFLNSSLIKHVSKLKLSDADIESFISLFNCSNLNQLKVLDLKNNTLDLAHVDYLKNCNMPVLTELNLFNVRFNESDALELLNSKFMSTIKKLDLSYSLTYFTSSFYESLSKSKYLNQITHLKIENRTRQADNRIDLLLEEKVNLNHLHIERYQLTHFSNLVTTGNYKNLTYLNIAYCFIKNQDLANIIISTNLPVLNTLILKDINSGGYINSGWIEDNTIAIFPRNSQISITELKLICFNLELFPSLFDHCPKLKKLTVFPIETSKIGYQKMINCPSLEFLYIISYMWSELIENIFISPIYSNLKVLELEILDYQVDNMAFLANCTNLINLQELDLSSTKVSRLELFEEFENTWKHNPTFSKLKEVCDPYFADEDSDD